MKKLLAVFIASAALFAASEAFAQDVSPSGVQFGLYGAYNQALGSVFQHETGNAQFGIDAFYQLPVKLPEWFPFSAVGISAGADFGLPVHKESYVNSWYDLNAAAGIWADWTLLSVFHIRPELRYGAAINIVDAPARNVKGAYVDQLIQPAVNFLWEPVSMKGFSLYGAVNFNILPEQQNTGNYLGLKIGLLYRPENTYRKQKAAEKLSGAAILEAQKKAELEEEIKKQAELENARLEAEKREAEALEKANEEELAKIKAEKEALEAQLKAAEEKAKAAEEEVRLAALEKERQEAEAKAKTVKQVEVQLNEDGSVDIAIPTLSFKSNSAQLNSTKANEDTLTKVYEILSNPDYSEFKCLVTGYVNPDDYEWTEEDKALALSRAETVITNLTQKGIAPERFTSACGSGKTSNKEYNRRVEFKLTK